MNFLTSEFKTKFNTAPFSKIKMEDYKPAFIENIAKAKENVNEIINNSEAPTFLQLDHDLGMDKNGKEIKVMHFLQWLFDTFPDKLPPDYSVHSKNPEGINNIHSFMNSWKKAYYL